jgi:hypothetical protein
VDSSTNPGQTFILESEYILPSTSGEIVLVAEIGGTDSSLILGDILQVTSPIANVDSFVTVISQEVAPVNDETIEEYRLKVINAYRTEPQGGAKVDYQLWAVDAAGVRRVYPYVVNNSPGDLEIFVESLYDDGVPDAAMLSEVEAVIEQDPDNSKPIEERGRKPMGIYSMDIKSVNLINVDITITGLTPSVQLSTLTNAISTNEYFEFSIQPQSGYSTSLNALNVVLRRSATGPKNYMWKYMFFESECQLKLAPERVLELLICQASNLSGLMIRLCCLWYFFLQINGSILCFKPASSDNLRVKEQGA